MRQNLTAALTLRTETMHSGAMGSLFSNAKGLQAAEILAAPCVIELADFSPQSASFIMNMLCPGWGKLAKAAATSPSLI